MVEIEKIKDNFAKLAAIDSPSLKERSMADYIIALQIHGLSVLCVPKRGEN